MNSGCGNAKRPESSHVKNTERAGKIVVRLVSAPCIATISRIADVENEFPCYRKWRCTLDSHSGKVEREKYGSRRCASVTLYVLSSKTSISLSLSLYLLSLLLSLLYFFFLSLFFLIYLVHSLVTFFPARQKALERRGERRRTSA